MTLMTNTCEACGDGRFTVTHHEAAHRCPVCDMVSRLDKADEAIAENEDLRAEIRDLHKETRELERERDMLEQQLKEARQ